MTNSLLALFPYVTPMLDAAQRLKNSGYDATVFSPIPLVHEMDDVIGPEKDYVRFFTFVGGVTGLLFGIVVVLGTAALYVLPRGGRPVFPVPPTLIISYETTILIGVCMTLLGFLVISKLPSFKDQVDDPRVSADEFGLLIDNVGINEVDKVEKILMEYGAKEVKRVD